MSDVRCVFASPSIVVWTLTVVASHPGSCILEHVLFLLDMENLGAHTRFPAVGILKFYGSVLAQTV